MNRVSESPLISIVKWTRTRADLAHYAVTSVSRQKFTHTVHELLIIENASTDATQKICPDAFIGPYYTFYIASKQNWDKDEYASVVRMPNKPLKLWL